MLITNICIHVSHYTFPFFEKGVQSSISVQITLLTALTAVYPLHFHLVKIREALLHCA